MLSKKLEEAINEQINYELFSAYYYRAIAAYYDANDLQGFAHFFKVQAEEEQFHAEKFYNYIYERGGQVSLKAIAEPPKEFASIADTFKKSLEHEKTVTARINQIMSLAQEENDYATISFLNWFIDEQVEEESSMEAYLKKVERVGEDGPGIFMLDNELGQRTFTPPTEE